MYFSRMPCVTLSLHILMMLLCDVDSPDPLRNRWFKVLESVVWNIVVQGLLQPIAALFVAIIVCPLIAFLILTGKTLLLLLLVNELVTCVDLF